MHIKSKVKLDSLLFREIRDNPSRNNIEIRFTVPVRNMTQKRTMTRLR